MNAEYQSDGFFSRKIVSKSMSKNISNIKEKILPYINKNSVCLEIAPGSGDMLLALIDDVKFYYTIDPSLVSLQIDKKQNHKHIQGFFNKEGVENKLNHKLDCVIFRHLLEHINTPLSFLKDVLDMVDKDCVIYVEVPNIDEFIQRSRFYEVFYEHFGYFQRNVLINAFLNLGCELIDEFYVLNDQHMGLFFKKSSFKDKEILDFKLYNNLNQNFNSHINKLNAILKDYQNIAIYGAGGHGQSCLCYVNDISKFKFCFDLDARKQGKYLQDSDIMVVEPCLQNFENLDLILLCAPLYENEILGFLRQSGYNKDICLSKDEIKISRV